MSIFAATIILAIASILALVVAVPLLYLLRKARKKSVAQLPGQATHHLTPLQALPGLLTVIVLFFAYAAEYVAPQSWLGQRVTTLEGKFWLFILVWLTLFAVERAVRSHRGKDKTDKAR